MPLIIPNPPCIIARAASCKEPDFKASRSLAFLAINCSKASNDFGGVAVSGGTCVTGFTAAGLLQQEKIDLSKKNMDHQQVVEVHLLALSHRCHMDLLQQGYLDQFRYIL